ALASIGLMFAVSSWNDYTNYKTNSAVLGEWNNYTTTTIAGTLLAKDAEVGLGDYGGTFTIENGGLIAAKGIGQATSAKAGTGKFELTLNDGGTLLLGTSGLSTPKTTNTVSLAAGTVGTFADSTTVATALTLTSETGTTFDTQKYVFADDGNSVTRGEEAAAMTVSGAISGTGNFIKTGAGTLTLSNNFGSFEGNFIVDAGELLLSGSNSAYSGQFVVNGGTLKLGTANDVLGATDLEGTGTRYAAVVKAGGTLDINGQTQGGSNCYQIELAGGALVNNGSGVGTEHRQISGLKLSADSEIGGSGNFGLIASGYAANTLDLGGNTLTKTGSNTFWLASTTVTAGTFKIQEGKVEVVSQTLSSVDASAAQFSVEGGELAIADNFSAGGISVSEGAAVTFSSGITVALGSTIQNAGTVTIGSDMIFNLDNLTPDGKNYIIISNTGTVSGWENLTIDNFTHSTQSNLRLSEEAGTYYVYAYHGALTWVGATDANGAGTWDLGSSAHWTYDENGTAKASCFFNEDDVIFATDGAQVTVASGLTVAPASMEVNENVTFLGDNYTIAPTGTITLAADKVLSLDGTGTLSGVLANSGTIAIGENATLGVSASTTAIGTVTGSGRIELPNTTLTDGAIFRDASAWTGTVAFTESLGGSSGFGFSVSNYGNAESVVELNGFAGGYFTEQANGTIASDLVLSGDVNLTNGNSGMTLTIDGDVSGTGSFSYNFNNGQIFVFNGSVALPAMAFAVGSGAKTFNGTVDLDSFSSNAGAVTFSGETTAIGTLTSGGNVSITAGTATIGTLTGSGTVTLSGASASVDSLSAGGNVSITAGTSTIGTLTQTAGTLTFSGDSDSSSVAITQLNLGENTTAKFASTSALYATAGERVSVGETLLANGAILETVGQGYTFDSVSVADDASATMRMADYSSVLTHTVTIKELSGNNATLNLVSTIKMNTPEHAVYTLGTADTEVSGDDFSGTISVSNTASTGSRNSAL
ncbi:MAG: hypothetical protein IJX22_04270, partial [Opitutales bacterium]|nr:hypothetical protein [Opitutales bacterium]